MLTQRPHTRPLKLDGTVPDRDPQTHNTPMPRCDSATSLNVLRMNVISGSVVNSRSRRSRWMAQLSCFSVGHRPRGPHASATRCASSLPASGLCQKSCFVLVPFLIPLNLLARYHFASLTRSPATHAQRALLFRGVRQQTCCKWSQHRVQFRWFFQPRVCVSAVRSLVHTLVLLVSTLDCLMF